MSYSTFIKIVDDLVAWGFMDPYYAMIDSNYLADCVNAYIDANKVVRKMMKFK